MSMLSGARILNARDYATVQDAVNAAEAYDTIVFPPGEYHSGSVRLKSNLCLRLEAGAVIVASTEPADYASNERHCRPRSLHRSLPWYFLGGFGLENLTIEGAGAIEGSGHAFWNDYTDIVLGHEEIFHGQFFHSVEKRPILLSLVDCRNVTLRGFAIRNAPAFTIHLLGCEQVNIDGLTVRNHRQGPNTDVLDIDCSSDVRVTNCQLDAGDDCIALKSDIAMLGRDKPCERIYVSGCTLSSTCCAIRLGYEGDGVIREAIFTGNMIYDTNKAFDLLSITPGCEFIKAGAKIENIIFANSTLRNVRRAFHLWSGSGEPGSSYQGYIRSVLFSGITAQCSDASFAGGEAVSDITFRDIRLTVQRNWKEYQDATPVDMPNVWARGFLPEPMTFYRTQPILENVIVKQNPQTEFYPSHTPPVKG